MKYIISATLVISGVIHLLPLAGIVGASQLNALYGVAIEDQNLELLMRHRAVLFGILGGFLVYSAFKVTYQTIAIIACFISTLAFLALAWMTPEYNPDIGKIVVADEIVIFCLIAATVARGILHKRSVSSFEAREEG